MVTTYTYNYPAIECYLFDIRKGDGWIFWTGASENCRLNAIRIQKGLTLIE